MNHALVLVLNAGSSSLKFALMNAQSGKSLLTGLAECLGLDDARMSWTIEGEDKQTKNFSVDANDHQSAVSEIVRLVQGMDLGDQLAAVGHRVVHGGEQFAEAVLLDDDKINQIEALNDLAPLHNPANVMGIRAAILAFPSLPHVAVFDTAFHQTMPEKAFVGGIAKELYEEYSIRRYGFHGTSHYYVSREAAKMLDIDIEQANFISVHLGNGASVCAIRNGQSVDTSMGFTPLAGLMMGTRSGDLDPGIIEFLLKKGDGARKRFLTH